MRFEIARLHQSLAAMMIYVTHDQVEAMTLADNIVVLDAGVIRQVGSPRMNVVACTVSDNEWRLPGHGRGPWPHARAPASLGIRPESISLVPPGKGT